MNNFEHFTTRIVQATSGKVGPISPPITNSASFGFESPEEAESIFKGEVKKPFYARMGNPTTAKLENVLSELEGGVGAICTSTGMGAIAVALLSLLNSGDEIIAVGGMFGGTYSLFHTTLARFGIKTTFIDCDDFNTLEKTVSANTKALFVESVSNPRMEIPDFEKLSEFTKKHAIAYIVDNTITPLSFRPFDYGADITVYSTTKLIAGNSSALGGAAIFRAINNDDEKFMNRKFKHLHKFIETTKEAALLVNAKKNALRDFGMSASAFNSYLTLLGIETLPLRLKQIKVTVETLVNELHSKKYSINHPLLASHLHHERYNKYFSIGVGPLFTVDFTKKHSAFEFLNDCANFTLAANIGDNRSLALHMRSTIYRDFTDEECLFLGISDALIRYSIGLEAAEDLMKDFN